MKFPSLALTLAAIASSPPCHSGEILQTASRILGTIPDGTPPPPAPPKPEFIIPHKDILRSTSQQQGGRTVTIREIKPLEIPPPPRPAEPVPSEINAAFAAKVAEYRKNHPRYELLFMGATVYQSEDLPPSTLVRCWPQNGRETITFWSSADFALIAGGISSFADSNGDCHHLFMSWGVANMKKIAALQSATGKAPAPLRIPDFPPGPATYQIIGTSPPAKDLVPIQSLHDLYNRNLAELTTAHQGREQARLAREAELKANPPQPKDITLNFWRIGGGTPVKGSAQ